MNPIIRWVVRLKRESSKSKTKIFSLVFVLAIVSASLYVFSGAGATIASDITTEKIIELTNQSRTGTGEKALAVNSKLSRAAQAKADDMIANNYFSHTSPAGATPWSWMQKESYDYNYAGENLAMDFQTTAKMEEAWMASPTHRANILNGKYSEMGTAVREGIINGHETTLAVVMFGSGDRNLSSATDEKKIAVTTDEPASSAGKSADRENKSENIFPALPSGEEKKNAIAFEQPAITSPQSEEIVAGSEIKIVGRAKAGETVAIFDNGNSLGSAVADENGLFALLEKNLAGGAHSLALQSKNLLSETNIEFYVDQSKPDIDFRLYADERNPQQFLLEASADKKNCTFQFNGEARYIMRRNKAVFSVGSDKSSAILRVSDQAGNKNFRQVNIANYYSGNEKNNISKKMATLFSAPKNMFALDSGREALKNNLNIAMGGLNNY